MTQNLIVQHGHCTPTSTTAKPLRVIQASMIQTYYANLRLLMTQAPQLRIFSPFSDLLEFTLNLPKIPELWRLELNPRSMRHLHKPTDLRAHSIEFLPQMAHPEIVQARRCWTWTCWATAPTSTGAWCPPEASTASAASPAPPALPTCPSGEHNSPFYLPSTTISSLLKKGTQPVPSVITENSTRLYYLTLWSSVLRPV